MRALLILLVGAVGCVAHAVAQEVPAHALLFNGASVQEPVVTDPEAYEALDAALTALPEGALAEAPCPSARVGGGESLTDEEMRAYFVELGVEVPTSRAEGIASFLDLDSRISPEPGGLHRLASSLPAPESASCLVLSGDDEAVLLVLQIWLALGWNLEFSALAIEAGGVIPLFFLPRFLLELRASFFQGSLNRTYVTLAALVTYATLVHPLIVASIGAGLGAQRQSNGSVSSWEVGPMVAIQLAYVGLAFRPMVQLALFYIYETLILTPAFGVIYPIP